MDMEQPRHWAVDESRPQVALPRQPGERASGGTEGRGLPRSDALAVAQMVRRVRLAARTGAEAHRDLFADPAWDMLLDLYVAQVAGRRVSVSDACIAAAVPQATALRWLNMLDQRGLVVRTADTTDRRRWWMTLSAEGVALVERMLPD